MITDDDIDTGGDGEDRSLSTRLYNRVKQSPVITGVIFGVVILMAGMLMFSGAGPEPLPPKPVIVAVGTETPAAEHETPAPAESAKPETLSEDSAPSAQVPVVAEAALLITDVGLSRRVSESIVRQLPKTTSIAVSPYATSAQSTVAAYKSAGNDVWLQIATRSTTAGIDPGPLALSVSMSNTENNTYLQRQIANAGSGFVGLYIPSDADLTMDADTWKAMASDLIGKNLMILDGTSAKVATELYMPQQADNISAYLKADVIVNGDKGPEVLKAGLAAAVPVILREREAIVVINRPTTLAITQLADWIKTLSNQGIALVPASKFTGLQP